MSAQPFDHTAFAFAGRVAVFALLASASLFAAYDLAKTYLRVDGGYSNWSPFSECSKTCGLSKRMRFRTCSNPPPKFGGKDCSELGEANELIRCDVPPCPVDGGYSEWRKWAGCPVSCGGGEEMRSRKCSSPFPRDGGKSCLEQGLGPEVEVRSCNKDVPCPVHGGYSEWSDYTDCSATCNGGQRTRTRSCDNPAPEHGGKDCKKLGPDTEKQACNIQDCPGE